MTGRRAAGWVGMTLAAIALAAACSAGQPAPPEPGSPASAAARTAAETRRAAIGQANRDALGLVALGVLGTRQEAGAQVGGLAPELTSQGQALLGAVREIATAAEVVLGDQLDPGHQALVTALATRSGQPFDAEWLAAAQVSVQQAREGAAALLTAPAVAAPAIGQLVAELDDLGMRLASAAPR